jgi:hypothetical protein
MQNFLSPSLIILQWGKGTKEEQEHAYLKDVSWRLECAKKHYLAPECSVGCPCYMPDRYIDITTITTNQDNTLISLPHEILLHLISFLSTRPFFLLAFTCKSLYTLSGDTSFAHHYIHQRQKKEYLEPCSHFTKHNTLQKVTSIFDQIITRVPEFAHELHTCYNESLNGFRTKQLPKDKVFPSTNEGRCTWARYQYNNGAGEAKKHVWEALELPTNLHQVAAWTACGTRTLADQRRQSSPQYKAATLERSKKKRKVGEEEIRVSAKRGDDYLGPARKTALAHKQVFRHILFVIAHHECWS